MTITGKTIAITNLGTIVSGDIDHPLLDGDTILVEDGRIKAVGRRKDLDPEAAEVLAVDKVRVRNQPQDRQATRHYDSA